MECTELISKDLAVEIIHLSVLFQLLCIVSETDNLPSLCSVLSVF